jgi:predicted nucleotidyltransferase
MLTGREALMSMLKDQIDLLSAFNAHGVEYVVVGGHAVNAHTQPRFTKDLDIFIRGSEANGLLVFKALAEYGAPLQGMTPADFSGKPNEFFQLGIEPNRVDIMQSLPGVSFESAWKDAIDGKMEGVPVKFLSREHLIVNKLIVGRPRDLGDVDELEKFSRKP